MEEIEENNEEGRSQSHGESDVEEFSFEEVDQTVGLVDSDDDEVTLTSPEMMDIEGATHQTPLRELQRAFGAVDVEAENKKNEHSQGAYSDVSSEDEVSHGPDVVDIEGASGDAFCGSFKVEKLDDEKLFFVEGDIVYLSTEQESEIMEWLVQNPIFCTKNDRLFKIMIKEKKRALMKAQASKMKLSFVTLNSWFKEARDRNARMKCEDDMSGLILPKNKRTERDEWILLNFRKMMYDP